MGKIAEFLNTMKPSTSPQQEDAEQEANPPGGSESKSAGFIKELISTSWSGSNEEQMKAVELLKGLATSDEPEANAFMKKIDDLMSGMKEEAFTNESTLRGDLKYRVKADGEGRFDLQFQSSTGSWIHVKAFPNKEDAHQYLKDNKEKKKA